MLIRKLKNEELKRISVEEFKKSSKIPLVIILDNVRSLNNIGSIFRTADAFMVEAIYLCGITACPPHKDIQKTALGATESVTWKYFKETKDALKDLQSKNYILLAIEQAENSTALNNFIPEINNNYAVIFGHEVEGISENILKIADNCLEIPQYGTKHSLNIAVSAGIVIWELSQKLRRNILK